MLAAILAIGQGTLAIKKRNSDERFELGFVRLAYNKKSGLRFVLILLLIGWSMSWTLRHFAAETLCNTVKNSTLIRDQNPSSAEIMKAISWDEYNAKYWYKLAQAHRREGAAEEGYPDIRIQALERAVLLNPFAPIYYLRLGWSYTRMGKEPDFIEKWLPKADRVMDLAAEYSGARDPGLHQEVGTYWIMRSTTHETGSELWDAAIEKAVTHYRSALSLERKRKREKLLEDIGRIIWSYYPGGEIIERIEIIK
jgi:tetratricopeptide (TPR) repeat protein